MSRFVSALQSEFRPFVKELGVPCDAGDVHLLADAQITKLVASTVCVGVSEYFPFDCWCSVGFFLLIPHETGQAGCVFGKWVFE